MNVVFFGSSHYVIPVIREVKNNFDLSLVVTTEKSPADPIRKFCNESKVCCYIAANFWHKNLIEKIKEIKPDIGVLGSFGGIIPKEILDLFPNGILNIHPSLLPKYRGPSPVQTAILNGDGKTGVSIIKLDEKVDHGPILAQKEGSISDRDTAETLYNRLFKKGAQMITSIIQSIEIDKRVEEKTQDDSKATFTKPLTRNSGLVYSDNPPSKEILERMVRAFYPWPGVWFKSKLNGKEVIIKPLPDEKIQVEGKKPMSFKDFINGYPGGKKILSNLKLLN